MTGTVTAGHAVRMKVLLLSTRPLGAAEIDRVLLSGLHPSAVDVCPSVNLALTRLETFPPDLVIVNLPERDAGDAVRRLQARSPRLPIVVVAPPSRTRRVRGRGAMDASDAQVTGERTRHRRQYRPRRRRADPHGAWRRRGRLRQPTTHITNAALADAREELDSLARGGVTDALDAETRWLLYEVASIGHVSTTLEGDILASNDVAAQLLGHFSPDALEAAGEMPRSAPAGGRAVLAASVTLRTVPAARTGRPAALDRRPCPAAGRHTGDRDVVPDRRQRAAPAGATRPLPQAHGRVDPRAVGRDGGVRDACRHRQPGPGHGALEDLGRRRRRAGDAGARRGRRRCWHSSQGSRVAAHDDPRCATCAPCSIRSARCWCTSPAMT